MLHGSQFNPPLTESGQFDESSSASIDDVVWSQVSGCRRLVEGGESNRGVIVANYGQKKIITKSSQEPAREMYLTRLCRHLGVSAPAIRFVLCGSKEYKEMGRVVKADKPVMLVMEFVEVLFLFFKKNKIKFFSFKGKTLHTASREQSTKFFCASSPQSAPG
jgi:hypothetical protein